MSIDLEDEILQDFLVEAGEILELLGEQLVELENTPDDLDLLNAIFRGFHTIKGGAGFLSIDAMVGVCHKAEDVFNVLRNGDRAVDTPLMDVILRVVDDVNVMFDLVRAGEMPKPVEQELLDTLQTFTVPDSADSEEADESIIKDASAAVSNELDVMLDSSTTETAAPADNGDITEEEFDKVLDELHGKGSFNVGNLEGDDKPKDAKKEFVAPSGDGDITEEEFDNYLDELHGKGKFNNSISEEVPAVEKAEVKKEEPKVEPKVEPKKEEPKTAAPKKAAPKKEAGGDTKAKAKSAPAETTVRVDTGILDSIMNMVGELVLVRNRFQTLAAEKEDEDIAKTVSNLDVVTADLQLAVMKTRMQPIKKVFGKFPRVVRDLSRQLGKEIKLELVGEETDLDKNLVEALADPLVHLVRNAVDHGVETPDVRMANDKPSEGTVILAASQEGDHIELSIKDDGAGMNADKLRGIAVRKGLMDEETAARLDDRDCFNLIFAPGFSTKDVISDVSGRGVGMDVVKTRISQMNGTVEVDSVEGEGSTITIKVPLTLAIMPTLMVKLGGQSFALPLASVLEILDLDMGQTQVVDGQMIIMVRNSALPLFYLSDWLIHKDDYIANKESNAHVVVVNSGGRQIGFVVDQLVGQEEVVIKALGAKLHGLDGLAGATITGDGQIALILDVPGLMNKYVD